MTIRTPWITIRCGGDDCLDLREIFPESRRVYPPRLEVFLAALGGLGPGLEAHRGLREAFASGGELLPVVLGGVVGDGGADDASETL